MSANWRWSAMPARAEPVNSRPSMPGSAMPARALRRDRRSAAGSTPSGIFASWKQSTRNAPVAGVFSDGLNTTALPAISAGTMWPLGKCAGKLYGPSTAEHAVRLVADRDLVAERRLEPPLRRALGISVDRDLDLVDHRRDLGPRFPKGLAGFARDQVGELAFASPHDVGEAAQGFGPVGDRVRGPSGQAPRARRRPRRRHRRPHRTRSPRRSPARSKRVFSTWPARSTMLRQAGQAAGDRLSVIASPIRRTAAILASNGAQSSRSAIAAQIASTSSMCIEQGSGSDQ